MAGKVGFEPTTQCFRGTYSTVELQTRIYGAAREIRTPDPLITNQ